jgi:hypothetical protein
LNQKDAVCSGGTALRSSFFQSSTQDSRDASLRGMRKIEQKFELHKQYIIEYTICKKGAILREKYKNYTKIVLTNYAGFGNILSTDNTDIHSFKGAMI